MKKNKPSLAGRPYKWRGRQTKVIRVPIEFLEEILKFIDYMDVNGGRLPMAFREDFPKYTRDFDELPYADDFLYEDDFEVPYVSHC